MCNNIPIPRVVPDVSAVGVTSVGPRVANMCACHYTGADIRICCRRFLWNEVGAIRNSSSEHTDVDVL